MKDILRRVLSILLPWAGLATIGRYTMNWTTIVKDYLMAYNYPILGLLAVVFLFFLVQYWLIVVVQKWLKVQAVLLWLVVILIAHYALVNDASNYIYASDIIMIIGVLMVYLPLAWLIVTEKTQQKIIESKQVIIEV